MIFDTNSIEQVKKALDGAGCVTIISHKSPDGDSIGSSMALAGVLTQITNAPIHVVVPDPFPNFLNWIHGTENVIIAEKHPERAVEALNKADVIFCLDFNNVSRVGHALQDVLAGAGAFKVMIDHHRDPDGFCTVTYSDISACSTAQLIYQFVQAVGFTDKIDRGVAEAMYCGIMTDTGSFKFSSTTHVTHQIVADLLKRGARNAQIHDMVYDNNSIDRIKLLGYALNKMEVYEAHKTAIMYLTVEEMERFNCKKGDTEGFVNYALSMRGIEIAAFFKETPTIVKISFRSKNNWFVNELSKDHFNGGGHKNAAGGSSDLSLQQSVAKFKDLFPDLIKYCHE